MNPADVHAFKLLCEHVLQDKTFLKYSHDIARFYKTHVVRVDNVSRLQQLLIALKPGTLIHLFIFGVYYHKDFLVHQRYHTWPSMRSLLRYDS